MRKKISTTIYLEPEQYEQLKELWRRTCVPVAVYIRQGVDVILKRYADDLKDDVPEALP